MPNPFPGVDPYIEDQGRWPDFHARFITYCCDALADRLPDHYEARIDEQFRLVEVPDALKTIEPDIALLRAGEPAPGRPADAAVAVLEPVTIPIPMTLPRRTERRIEVLHRPDRSLVAVIEILSPSTKAPGRQDYLEKRLAVLRQDVHLVELDLLLSGQRLPMLEPLPPGDFFAFVARADRRPDCDVYAWSIRRRALPNHIPIPLRAPDPDVSLDLAAVYATAHEKGRYARSLDYDAPLKVPLAPDDPAWADARAREAARR
jgi:hypothetical protein